MPTSGRITTFVGDPNKKICDMSRKQALFVKVYLATMDPQFAYVEAGYKGEPKEGAPSLMRTYVIDKAISSEMNKRSKRLDITADSILKELAKLGFDDDAEYLEIKPSDKIKALELMGKAVGMFKEHVEHEIKMPNLILRRSKGITIEHDEIKDQIMQELPEGHTLTPIDVTEEVEATERVFDQVWEGLNEDEQG